MTPRIDEVLSFWFGVPAKTSAELEKKIKRWFRNGASLDGEIVSRFGDLVARALAGDLDGWAATTRGRLGLIIVLDQLTRHVFRGTPRMYDGDVRALRLAIDAFDLGLDQELDVEELIFLTAPFVHAEDLAVVDRGVDLIRAQVDAAPAALRPALEIGFERACLYRSLIERFGRFPHRNHVLGRVSTPDEEEFMRVAS